MNLHELFDKCLNKNLIDLTISGRKDKLQDEVSKVKIRPVIIKNNLLFQVSEYKGTKVYHDNYSEADVRNYIEKMMTDNFKQAQFKMTDADAQVLSGKNSNMTIKYKKSCEVRCQKELSHNRNKKYILEEGKKVDFLVDLGVMTKECNRLAKKYGYEKLEFHVGDIASFKDVEHVDMVITLHACDTATDYALGKAVKWGAKVILSVPCRQHEANGQIKSELLSPVFKYGILKERMAAIFTDAIRADILEANGYQTQILEFIDMEHTPKNLLIRAVYTGKKNGEAAEKLKKMESELNLDLTLNKLL